MKPRLTFDNWKDATGDALSKLPANVLAKIKCEDAGRDRLRITCAVNAGERVFMFHHGWFRDKREEPFILFTTSSGGSFTVGIGTMSVRTWRATVVRLIFENLTPATGGGF